MQHPAGGVYASGSRGLRKAKMKRQDRLAGMLGMAAKAGKLVYGCNLTVEKVRRQPDPPISSLSRQTPPKIPKKGSGTAAYIMSEPTVCCRRLWGRRRFPTRRDGRDSYRASVSAMKAFPRRSENLQTVGKLRRKIQQEAEGYDQYEIQNQYTDKGI